MEIMFDLPLEGFQIPEWDGIKALAVAAARLFLPVRTVGWDVALGRSGPCILEGNIWYDPSLQGYLPDYWALPFVQ
jgi:hypothetical protein